MAQRLEGDSGKRAMARGIGDNIRRFRRSLRDEASGRVLSQEKLAQRVGVSRETIRKAEAGEDIPRWTTLEAVAKELNVSLWALLPPQPGLGGEAEAASTESRDNGRFVGIGHLRQVA